MKGSVILEDISLDDVNHTGVEAGKQESFAALNDANCEQRERNRRSGALSSYTVFQLVLISLIAAGGIAMKPVVSVLVHMITGPLNVPGGVIAGGFYMMWLVIARALIPHKTAATATALIQALLVMVMGGIGSHGVFTIFSYVIPGIAVDASLLIMRHRACCEICCFISCMLANISGVLISNYLFFRLPLIPLVIAVSGGAFSGGVGGLMAYYVTKSLLSIKLVSKFIAPKTVNKELKQKA